MKTAGFSTCLIGLLSLMLGIYISTDWMVAGTILGLAGGILMGGSIYFFIGTMNNSHT